MPDPCDCREVLDRLDRILQLLEGRKAKREGGIVENPDGPPVGGGCVIQGDQRPDSGIQIHIDPHHVIGATIHELRRQGRLRP